MHDYSAPFDAPVSAFTTVPQPCLSPPAKVLMSLISCKIGSRLAAPGFVAPELSALGFVAPRLVVFGFVAPEFIALRFITLEFVGPEFVNHSTKRLVIWLTSSSHVFVGIGSDSRQQLFSAATAATLLLYSPQIQRCWASPNLSACSRSVPC